MYALLCARGCQDQSGDRTMRLNQAGGNGVPWLRDTTPCRSGKAVLGQQAATQRRTHAATADCARRVRASPTSSRLGEPPPARSVTVQAIFRTRS